MVVYLGEIQEIPSTVLLTFWGGVVINPGFALYIYTLIIYIYTLGIQCVLVAIFIKLAQKRITEEFIHRLAISPRHLGHERNVWERSCHVFFEKKKMDFLECNANRNMGCTTKKRQYSSH